MARVLSFVLTEKESMAMNTKECGKTIWEMAKKLDVIITMMNFILATFLRIKDMAKVSIFIKTITKRDTLEIGATIWNMVKVSYWVWVHPKIILQIPVATIISKGDSSKIENMEEEYWWWRRIIKDTAQKKKRLRYMSKNIEMGV
jgi:hypothetical protein